MQSVICVYLHGFLSSANSQKGRWIVQQVQTENNQITARSITSSKPVFKAVITPTYPIVSPQESVFKIESLLQDLLLKNPTSLVLMGSSMGGYYAQFLGQKYKIPYIMINPALHPQPVFMQNLGPCVNPNTGEKFVIDEAYIQQLKTYDVAKLDKTVPALLLLDAGDEVIDVEAALSRYQSNDHSEIVVKTFKGGDHAFQHLDQAWPVIKSFITKL